jgi:hypothetical protein
VYGPIANLLRRWRYGDDIVVVSGLPRSGTSMMMRMLAAAGVPILIDGERTADIDNPHGYFELERVKRLESDPDRGWLREARGKAIKVVSPLLRWLPLNHQYRVIFMRRDLDEVIASQNRMLEHRQEPNPLGDARARELYARHLEDVTRLMRRRRCVQWLELDYDEAIAHPEATSRRVCTFLQRPEEVQSMAQAVDASLYRNRRPA